MDTYEGWFMGQEMSTTTHTPGWTSRTSNIIRCRLSLAHIFLWAYFVCEVKSEPGESLPPLAAAKQPHQRASHGWHRFSPSAVVWSMIHDSHKDSLSRTPKYFLLSLLCISFARDQLRNTQSLFFFFSLPPRLHGGNNRIIHVFIYSTAMCVYLLHVRTPYIIYYYPPPFFFFISFSRIFWAAPPFWPLPFLCSAVHEWDEPHTAETLDIYSRPLIIFSLLYYSMSSSFLVMM